MSLRQRGYLNEGGGSVALEYPSLSSVKGAGPGNIRRDFRMKVSGYKSDVDRAVAKVLTWTKRKNSNEQWSKLRLKNRNGVEEDIFINFYEDSSGFYPKGKAFRLVAFRPGSSSNLLNSDANTVRDARKQARVWLAKYMVKNIMVSVSRILPMQNRRQREGGSMSLRQRGYLTEQKSYIPWKKIKRVGVYRAKGAASQNMWDWKAVVGKDTWMLRQTKMHPDRDFEHEYKRSFWQVYRNGKAYKKPVQNLETAKNTVEKWVKAYGV